MGYGIKKSPAFSRFHRDASKDRKQVLYMQPSLFVADAQEFIKKV